MPAFFRKCLHFYSSPLFLNFDTNGTPYLLLIALVITGVGSILLIFRSAFQPNPPTLVVQNLT